MRFYIKVLNGDLIPLVVSDDIQHVSLQQVREHVGLKHAIVWDETTQSHTEPDDQIPIQNDCMLHLFVPLRGLRARLLYVRVQHQPCDTTLAHTDTEYEWGDVVHGIDIYADVMDINTSHTARAIFDGEKWITLRNRVPPPFEILTLHPVHGVQIPLGYWAPHAVEWERFCPTHRMVEEVQQQGAFELDGVHYQVETKQNVTKGVWYVKPIGKNTMKVDSIEESGQ